jgi:hypothetical protein
MFTFLGEELVLLQPGMKKVEKRAKKDEESAMDIRIKDLRLDSQRLYCLA